MKGFVFDICNESKIKIDVLSNLMILDYLTTVANPNVFAIVTVLEMFGVYDIWYRGQGTQNPKTNYDPSTILSSYDCSQRVQNSHVPKK